VQTAALTGAIFMILVQWPVSAGWPATSSCRRLAGFVTELGLGRVEYLLQST
jgi:hypothetical protein